MISYLHNSKTVETGYDAASVRVEDSQDPSDLVDSIEASFPGKPFLVTGFHKDYIISFEEELTAEETITLNSVIEAFKLT